MRSVAGLWQSYVTSKNGKFVRFDPGQAGGIDLLIVKL